MKTDLLLVALVGLLSGCTDSNRDVGSPPAQSSKVPAPPAASPSVYFVGAFTKTGAYAWTNGMTLQDGIAVAGGFTQWADRQLRVVHRDGSRERYYLGPGRTLTNNPALKPADMVFIRPRVDAF